MALPESRKRKSPEPEPATPTLLLHPPAPPERGEQQSPTQMLLKIVQMSDLEELRQARSNNARLADEHAAHVTRLRAEHTADMERLAEELCQREAEKLARLRGEHAAHVARLNDHHADSMEKLTASLWQQEVEKQLARLSEQHADELRAVKLQHGSDLIKLKHQSTVCQTQLYIAGLTDMMNQVLDMYPGVVKPSELRALLPDADRQGPQSPAQD